MNVKDILNTIDHRPWKLPKESWKYYQEWNDAIFLHWEVTLDDLQQFVPKELEIDLFDGKPWVSLVAFTMEKIRPKGLPSFPPISNFDEINIRTYIKSNNKTGVYFLSIEGGKRLSCKIAKGISELPYRFSKTKRTKGKYESRNSEFQDNLSIEYEIANKKQNKTDLDLWLTERYALFQDTEKVINEFEIHHLAWDIKEINIKKLDVDYPRFQTLLRNKPNCCHYAEGVKVLAWDKRKKDKTSYQF
ncbi:YqjF family protein [Aquimarina litoralis]|uniref:YqjF family protein n=1 Tax=Aquimarina litoralis TaxID=584605 RepID=UPI001C567057|nr:DUF2071 domain-containing protein [Aquimarina litoralis]MBW1295694.1 DUF2071 domain-containing protein [Aquimarina litoralis]